MLPHADLDLIRRDRVIPGLATLLNREEFTAALHTYLPEVKYARMDYIRYEPSTDCRVRYQVKISGVKTNVYAKAHGPDKLIKFENACQKKTVVGPAGQDRLILKDKRIVILFFPNDFKLRSLRYLANSKDRKRLLRRVFQDKPSFWDGKYETLQYRPERRYAARIKSEDGLLAVIKFYDPRGFSRSKSNAMSLKSRGKMQIAQCIGSSDRHKVLAFEWLSGRLLDEVITEQLDLATRALRDTGEALAELHSQETGDLAVFSSKDQARSLLGMADWLGFISPKLSWRVGRLAQWLAGLILKSNESCPIHGDFYARQVIIMGSKVGFLDLDEVVLGNPLIDLGHFIANLEYDALFGRFPTSPLSVLEQAFLDGYQKASGRQITSDLKIYTAAGLFRLLARPFRDHHPHWRERMEQILQKAEEIVGEILSEKRDNILSLVTPVELLTRSTVSNTSNGIHEQWLPTLAGALDRRVMKLRLTELIQLQTGEGVHAKLKQIKLKRYKPGLRWLVEYKLGVEGHNGAKNSLTLLGKARVWGVDSTTYELCKGLWNNGFHAMSTDGISIPRPLGIIPERRMWIQEKVEGIPATQVFMKNNGIELAKRVAEAIHKLHRANLPTEKQHAMVDELSKLREYLRLAEIENPSWKDRIEKLLKGCEQLASYVAEPEYVGIHGDFYPDQVIVDGNRVYITDFDLYCRGDPALDIGNFLGHMEEQALRCLDDPFALSSQEEALVNRFLELSNKSKRLAIDVYTTLTLARHVWISTQFPERRPFTERLLSLCEERLGKQLSSYRHGNTSIRTTSS